MSGTGLWETRPQGCKQTGRGSIPEGRRLFSPKGLRYQVLASAKAVKLSGSRNQPGQGKGTRGWRPPNCKTSPRGDAPASPKAQRRLELTRKERRPRGSCRGRKLMRERADK